MWNSFAIQLSQISLGGSLWEELYANLKSVHFEEGVFRTLWSLDLLQLWILNNYKYFQQNTYHKFCGIKQHIRNETM